MKSIFVCHFHNLINRFYQFFVIVAIFQLPVLCYGIDQPDKSSFRLPVKIVANGLSHNAKTRNAIVKRYLFSFASTDDKMESVYLMPPLLHECEKICFPFCFAGFSFADDRQPMSSESGNQSANNASGNKSANVNNRVYVAIQDMIKIVVCGAIGGMIALAICQRR